MIFAVCLAAIMGVITVAATMAELDHWKVALYATIFGVWLGAVASEIRAWLVTRLRNHERDQATPFPLSSRRD